MVVESGTAAELLRREERRQTEMREGWRGGEGERK